MGVAEVDQALHFFPSSVGGGGHALLQWHGVAVGGLD